MSMLGHAIMTCFIFFCSDGSVQTQSGNLVETADQTGFHDIIRLPVASLSNTASNRPGQYLIALGGLVVLVSAILAAMGFHGRPQGMLCWAHPAKSTCQILAPWLRVLGR
eukprot:s909_g20.t1